MLRRTTRDLGSGLALSLALAGLIIGCGDGGAGGALAESADPEALSPGSGRQTATSAAGSEATGGAGGGAPSGTSGVPGVNGGDAGVSGSEIPLEPGTSGPLGEALPEEAAQDWVFDPAAVHSYQVTLDPEVWESLQRNARDEQYAEADFSAGGQSLGRIGLRFKGSLGTLTSCFADDGTPRCSKMSMKLKFGEYVPEQRFAGLERLNFNSMLYDDSLMHERLAYRVFRQMGISAPRSAHARLVINGEDWGVFSLVEDVDGRFTDHHFEGGDGNLYKEAWPSNADAAILAEALETNEEVADNTGFLQFRADLADAAPEELPSVLERYVDVDQLLAYLAVDQTLVNWDGITAFYCYDGFCENHNYFWYQDEAELRFSLIPWDLDNTFEPSPIGEVPGPFALEPDCSTPIEAMGRLVLPAGCDPIVRGLVQSGGERYVAQLDRLLEGPLAAGTIEGWIDELEVQLAPEVKTDTRGPDLETFETEVERLRSAVGNLRESAEADRGTHL